MLLSALFNELINFKYLLDLNKLNVSLILFGDTTNIINVKI